MPPKGQLKPSVEKYTRKGGKKKGDKPPAEPSRVSARISAKIAEQKAAKELQRLQLEQEQPTATAAIRVHKKQETQPSSRSRKKSAKQRPEASVLVPLADPQIPSKSSKKVDTKTSRRKVISGERAISPAGPPVTSAATARLPSHFNHVQSWAVRTTGEAFPEVVPVEEVPLAIDPEYGEYYQERGYEVPDEEYVASMGDRTSLVLTNVTGKSGKPKGVGPTNPKFPGLLLDHNIGRVRTEDANIATIKSLVFANLPTSDGEDNIQDETWQLDMCKCLKSNEAIFQRTVMMTMLNRHQLDEKLDYSCETTWNSGRYPCRDCAEKECKLTKPLPDLAVAFDFTAFKIDGDGFESDFRRLGPLIGHIFAEGDDVSKTGRCFHFFAMEVKGRRGTIDNSTAELQNLHTASQALYNIYRCMREVDDLDTFFKDVRFFSVIGTAQSFWLRVHRPYTLTNHRRRILDKNYPVGFLFDDVIKLDATYSRSKATGIVYNILVNYGIKQLFPILKRTVERLFDTYQAPRPRPLFTFGNPISSQPAVDSPVLETEPGQASQPPRKKRRIRRRK